MHAVSFPAGQVSDLLLLIGSGEIESRNVRSGIDLARTQGNRFLVLGDFLPNGFVGSKRIAALIHIGEPGRFTQANGSGIRLLLIGNQTE